jgi:hypothetical protein
MIVLSEAARTDVCATLQAVYDRAAEARKADDLVEIKRLLPEVWRAVHIAYETVSAAEREARAELVSQSRHRRVA